MALMSYALEEMVKKGFTPIEPPFPYEAQTLRGRIALSDFEDDLYKIEGEDLYLIATSEHPMAAMYMDEVLKAEDLPINLLG
jgi:seryl-tRNA synthetase